MSRRQKAQAALRRFITKASKRNEPLEAFRETDVFKRLQQAFVDGITDQAKWLAGELDSLDFLQGEPADGEMAKLGQWLKTNMPPLADYISETKLTTYLTNAFIWSIEAQYKRYGVVLKADPVDFKLTNPKYIASLKNQANYLLHKSKIDDTTREQMISAVAESRLQLKTIDEVASDLVDRFDEVSEYRGFMIANTEANQSMSTAQMAFMRENEVPTKIWVAAGPNTCPVCQANEDDGEINREESFSSGDEKPPAHPNCECYLDAGEIDLDAISIWDGS